MEAAPVLPQPSFPRVADYLTGLSEEFSRCQNLPAVDGGLRLAQALEAMRNDLRNEMQTMRNEMQTINRKLDDLDRKVDALDGKVDALDRRVDGLDRKITVSDKNVRARMLNGVIIFDNVALAPLYSVLSGDLIDGCPSTLQELDALTARQVDALLTQLGESGRGRPDARRRQLEVALGVRSRATRSE